jgi:hypothetical protein
MEGLSRASGAFSIQICFREIKCQIVTSCHRGHPRNTQAITSSETVTGWGWRIFISRKKLVGNQQPNFSAKTRPGASRRTLQGCLNCWEDRELLDKAHCRRQRTTWPRPRQGLRRGKKNITSWIENCAFRYTQARNRPQLLLEVMANFREQLARAKRFGHIIVTTRRRAVLSSPLSA